MVSTISSESAPAAESAAPAAASAASGEPAALPLRPDAAFLRARLSHLIALGFGCGLSPIAPGTVATAWAWLSFNLLIALLAPGAMIVIVGASFLLGIWACGQTSTALGVHDHASLVWDEIAAFWLVLLFTPASLSAQVLAFLLFRFFDIVKPPPIRRFDARLKGGFGVMFDDFLAALFALFALALLVRAGWLG